MGRIFFGGWSEISGFSLFFLLFLLETEKNVEALGVIDDRNNYFCILSNCGKEKKGTNEKKGRNNICRV